jgi:hypothetical protein
MNYYEVKCKDSAYGAGWETTIRADSFTLNDDNRVFFYIKDELVGYFSDPIMVALSKRGSK